MYMCVRVFQAPQVLSLHVASRLETRNNHNNNNNNSNNDNDNDNDNDNNNNNNKLNIESISLTVLGALQITKNVLKVRV